MPSDTCSNGHKQRAYFNTSSDGVGDVARDEPGQLMPTTAVDYPGVVYDFPEQVIKLRIGKFIEMPGRKSKFEYQFVTPTVTREKVIPVKDTRTAQCAPCCPGCCPARSARRALPSLPFYQDIMEDQIMDVHSTHNELKLLHTEERIVNLFKAGSSIPCSETMTTNDKYLLSNPGSLGLSTESFPAKVDFSRNSLHTIRSKRHNDFKSHNVFPHHPLLIYNNIPRQVYGKQEIVYMTLFNDFYRRRTSGTQATASINKCLQVSSCNVGATEYTPYSINSNYWSSCNSSTVPYQEESKRYILPEPFKYSDIYFFGRKKDDPGKSGTGMGCSGCKIRPQKFEKSQGTSARSDPKEKKRSAAGVQAKSPSSTTGTGTTGKAVSIKDDKSCKQCPPVPACIGKTEMIATVSHIRIGPKDPCPVHGMSPCQGPKCIIAASGQEDQAPVKVSTVTNPRRGVFEIVIRRMTGAPLAKNELMLEWTPPPSRPPPCGTPCPTLCSMPICRPPKCKLILCKPTKCCRKPCKKSCAPPCGSTCGSSCGPPCGSCGPGPCCGSPPCRPACVVPCRPPPCRIGPCKRCCKSACCKPPAPCTAPCGPPCANPCTTPCKSSPCLRPCPVGYRRPRRIRSQPKIKGHRKRISPCCNRSRTCPVVRCRSRPCIGCCGVFSCPPRKCCSVFPCSPRKCCLLDPCRPKSCKSCCST